MDKEKKKEETSWDTNVAMCDNDEQLIQERQVEASHYKMGVVMQVMIQGPSAKQSKPHPNVLPKIHGERSYNCSHPLLGGIINLSNPNDL